MVLMLQYIRILSTSIHNTPIYFHIPNTMVLNLFPCIYCQLIFLLNHQFRTNNDEVWSVTSVNDMIRGFLICKPKLWGTDFFICNHGWKVDTEASSRIQLKLLFQRFLGEHWSNLTQSSTSELAMLTSLFR